MVKVGNKIQDMPPSCKALNLIAKCNKNCCRPHFLVLKYKQNRTLEDFVSLEDIVSRCLWISLFNKLAGTTTTNNGENSI